MSPASVRATGVAGVLASLVLLGSAPALAASHTVPFSPVDLANGSVLLPDDVEFEDADAQLSFGAGGGKCEVVVSGHAIAPTSDGGCPQLFAMAEPKRLEARLTSEGGGSVDLAFTATTTGSPVRLTLKGSEISVPAAFPGAITEVAVLGYDGPATSAKPTRWAMTPIEDGHIALEGTTAEIAKSQSGRFRVYGVVWPEGDDAALPTVYEFQVLAGSGPAVTPGPGPEVGPGPGDPNTLLGPGPEEPYDPNNPPQGDPGDPGATGRIAALPAGALVPPDLQCPPKKLPHEDMIVVCVDATGPSMTYRMVPEGTRLTKPNRYFYVQVVHRAEHHVSMDLGGQIGSYVPGTRGKFEVGHGGFGFDGQASNDVVLMSSSRTFAPRRPGFAPLVVRMTDANRQQVVDPLILEFWVEETYAGAFRVGVAGTFFGGVEQKYSKVTRPNSQQEEIAASGQNLMDIDLVLGYAPYLDHGGRGATGCEHAPFCFEPYFGLGLVNVDGGGGLDWLKSVHLGVEWELTNEFAVALTGNVRRVSRLAEGYAPGFPVDGEIPTEDRYVFGVGLVVNLSPSFLRIGAGGAAELLK